MKATDFASALFVDGKWRKAASGKTFAVREPSTGKVLCHVAEAGTGLDQGRSGKLGDDAIEALSGGGR